MPAAVDVIASPSARDATGRRICLGVVRPPPLPSLSLPSPPANIQRLPVWSIALAQLMPLPPSVQLQIGKRV